MRSMRQVFFITTLLFSVSFTGACLNDRETYAAEREFQSRYESPTNPGAAGLGNADLAGKPSALPQMYAWNYPGTIAGFSMMAAAVVITKRMLARTRKKPC